MKYILNGALHSNQYVSIPEGAFQLTDSQYSQLQTGEFVFDGADIVPYVQPGILRNIKSEIAQLESAQLMPRVTREFMLAFTESAYTPEQLALNIGYTRLKAFDEEVKALRELL